MSAIEEFAAKKRGAKSKTPKENWTPPGLADFRKGRVIGIDQSLANCGIVALNGEDDPPWVFESLTLRTQQVADGPEDTLLRTEQLRQRLVEYLDSADPAIPVRHEQPLPIRPGMKGSRPEAAWLAAGAVRAACALTGHPVSMIGAQRHKNLTVGVPNADKAAYHKLLMPWAISIGIERVHYVTNVDERDAFGIALAHLLED